MQSMFSRELAAQHIAELHQEAAKARLVRDAKLARRAAARHALRELLHRTEVPVGAADAGRTGLAELSGGSGSPPAHPRSGDGA